MFDKFRSKLANALVPKTKSGVPNAVLGNTLMGVSNFNPPKRGTQELLDLYSESPWIRAVVNKIGSGVSDTTWRLFYPKDIATGRAKYDPSITRMTKKKRDARITKDLDINAIAEITDHPLLSLLEAGNEALTGKTVMQLIAQHIDLCGEAFIVMERNALGVPIALWPVPPAWVRRTPNAVHDFYTIHGIYGAGMSSSNIDIPKTEMIYIKDANPANPYGRGTGVAAALSDEIEIDEYAAKHLKAFFYNRAKPDLIISGDNIGRDDTVRLEEKWLEKHQGFMNAFKPLFMSRKVDIKELSQNMEQQQMVQLREQERNTIIQVFGVSPEILGIVGDSKRSTISMADMFFSKHVITPRVELVRAYLQKFLVPIFDERLILDFDSPVAEDVDFTLEVMKAEPAAFTLNDWRALAKRETLGPKGKVVLVPVNQDIIAVSDLKNPDARQSAQVGANSGDTSSAANNNGVASKKWFDTTVAQQDAEDENKKVVDTYESLIKELNSEIESGKVSKVLITKIREITKPEQIDKGQENEPTN